MDPAGVQSVLANFKLHVAIEELFRPSRHMVPTPTSRFLAMCRGNYSKYSTVTGKTLVFVSFFYTKFCCRWRVGASANFNDCFLAPSIANASLVFSPSHHSESHRMAL